MTKVRNDEDIDFAQVPANQTQIRILDNASTDVQITVSIINSIKGDDQPENIVEDVDKLCKLISRLSQRNLQIILTKEFRTWLIRYIGQCQSPFELKVLDLIEIIADRGVDFLLPYQQNRFFDHKTDEQLMERIQQALITISKSDQQEQWASTDVALKLACITSYILKVVRLNVEQSKIIGSVVKAHTDKISSLFNVSRKKLEINIEQQNECIIEKECTQLSKALKIISTSTLQDSQKIVSQSNCKQQILSLLHINCPLELECKLRIDLPASDTTKKLQSSVYGAVSQICCKDEKIKDSILDEYKILSHLGPLIMGLQQGADKASVVLVGESLNLCQSLCSAYSTISDDVFKIKGFVEKIIDLMQFKVSEDEAQKKDLEDLLKVNSMKCVSQFQFYGGPDKQQKLVKEMKYIKSLVISIGCAGGTEHEKNYQTLHALYAFISLVDSIYGKISWCLPNIHLLKDLREELQENGGNEEIDANCFSCLGQSHYEIGGVAIRLKNYELWKNNQ